MSLRRRIQYIMPEASGEALRFHPRTRARAACRCYCVFARFCGLFFEWVLSVRWAAKTWRAKVPTSEAIQH